jgi:hypothetical protein
MRLHGRRDHYGDRSRCRSAICHSSIGCEIGAEDTRVNSSVLDRFTARDVLSAVGVAVPEDIRKPICCPLPAHDDTTPSFRVYDRGFVCFGCGAKGGLLDLVITLGKARDRAGAARWLERLR